MAMPRKIRNLMIRKWIIIGVMLLFGCLFANNIGEQAAGRFFAWLSTLLIYKSVMCGGILIGLAIFMVGTEIKTIFKALRKRNEELDKYEKTVQKNRKTKEKTRKRRAEDEAEADAEEEAAGAPRLWTFM